MQHKTPYNDNLQSHGYWEYYYSNGQLWYKVNFVNGEPSGLLERYYLDNKLDVKQYYAK